MQYYNKSPERQKQQRLGETVTSKYLFSNENFSQTISYLHSPLEKLLWFSGNLYQTDNIHKTIERFIFC